MSSRTNRGERAGVRSTLRSTLRSTSSGTGSGTESGTERNILRGTGERRINPLHYNDIHCFIKINDWSIDTRSGRIYGFARGGACGCFLKIRNVIIAVINFTVIVRLDHHYYGLLLGAIDPHFLNERETYYDYLREISMQF